MKNFRKKLAITSLIWGILIVQVQGAFALTGTALGPQPQPPNPIEDTSWGSSASSTQDTVPASAFHANDTQDTVSASDYHSYVSGNSAYEDTIPASAYHDYVNGSNAASDTVSAVDYHDYVNDGSYAVYDYEDKVSAYRYNKYLSGGRYYADATPDYEDKVDADDYHDYLNDRDDIDRPDTDPVEDDEDKVDADDYHDYLDEHGEESLCQNRYYPWDIDGHWSEIYVRRLYDLCIVEGYRDGSFRPDQNVTRAELTKMALYAKGIEPKQGCYDNDCGSPFNDLDRWQGPWVRKAWDLGIVQGYSYHRFMPNKSITRAEAVKVVLATYGVRPENVSRSFFNDVEGWSTGWIEAAHNLGIVQGIGNGNFSPNRPITRAEAAKVIAKTMEWWDTKIDGQRYRYRVY
jgi:hypothetical protein